MFGAAGCPVKLYPNSDAARRGVDAYAMCAALEKVPAGDVVLPSPACASLDMCLPYAPRAEVFAAAARRLPGVSPR